jgi:hypothetical protein
VDDGFDASQKLDLPGASFVGAQSHLTGNLVINGYNGAAAVRPNTRNLPRGAC